MDLADQIQRLCDVDEIERLLVEYGRTLDARDFAGCAAQFAAQGEWVGGFGSAVGPSAIRDLFERYLGPAADRAPTGAHHLMTNMAIDVTDDSATAWSRWTFVAPDADGAPTLLLSGHYDDIIVRENGSWRFRRRGASTDLSRVPPG